MSRTRLIDQLRAMLLERGIILPSAGWRSSIGSMN
jgi:hypothetical protein